MFGWSIKNSAIFAQNGEKVGLGETKEIVKHSGVRKEELVSTNGGLIVGYEKWRYGLTLNAFGLCYSMLGFCTGIKCWFT